MSVRPSIFAPAEAPALWATLHELLTDFAREGVKVDTTAAGGQIAVASAAVALASGDFDAALQRLARHHFAHYDHAPRPALTDRPSGRCLASSDSRSKTSRGTRDGHN